MAYSPELLQAELDRIKKRKEVASGQKLDWANFMPQELTFKSSQNPEMYSQLQQSVANTNEQATAIALIEAQNRRNKELFEQAQQQHNIAQQHYIGPKDPTTPSGGVPGNAPPGYYGGGNWGPDGIPEVSDIGKLNPNAPLKTVNWKGRSFTVNSQVAPIFRAFLNDLWRMGYQPLSIQGYSDRNIAGTNTPSLHSYGFAIDIDPGKNPVYNDNNPANDVYALPPNVGALAAKYGLSWGGNWNSYKDYMHFSVPWGGRE